jgi:hypothetical protein
MSNCDLKPEERYRREEFANTEAARGAGCGAGSMAFAPSVLDSAYTDNAAALNLQQVMSDGMQGALRAERQWRAMRAPASLAASLAVSLAAALRPRPPPV